GRGRRFHHMADAIQREGAAERRIRAGMCGAEEETGSHCLAGLAADSGGEADMSHIIVAFSKRENAANIRNILMRSGMDVSAVCLTAAAVLKNADTWNEGIVICGYQMQDMQYTRLRELLPEQFEMLLAAPPDRWVGTELPDGVVGLPMPI